MVLVQVMILTVLLLLLVVVVLVVVLVMVMLLLGLLLLLLMMVIGVGGFVVVAAAVLSLYVIAIHDPCVVGVGNFQSSALLIIGIYPSRYHENKFSLIRSTGKIKQKKKKPQRATLGCCYCLMMIMMMRTTVVLLSLLLLLRLRLLLHTTISPPVYMLLYLLTLVILIFFFYFTLCSCNSSHFSHSHCARSWRTMEQKRRFCCRATAIYRADEWSQLPQLLGWLSNLSKRVVVTALTKVIATLLICTSESAQKISDYFFFVLQVGIISLVPSRISLLYFPNTRTIHAGVVRICWGTVCELSRKPSRSLIDD